MWAAAGLATLYLGDEAVLDLDRFSLEGRAVRIARQSWNRARRAGFTALACHSGDLDPDSVSALRELPRRWRGETAERGFSMALGRLFDPRDAGALLVVARNAAGRPLGFLHFVPWSRHGASLDVMRRDRDSPGYRNDFLIVEAARRLAGLGVRRLSLNFSFLRAAGGRRRTAGAAGAAGGALAAPPPVRPLPDRDAVPVQQEVRPPPAPPASSRT